MSTAVTLALACLFVFLAGFNLWNMLTGRVASPGSLWTRVHRSAGYAFIALFVVFCYFMALRLKGLPDELPPRLIAHMGLALLLAPLLFVKVLVARYQKAARGLLNALGIAIFTAAFTLVALNALVGLLREASPQKTPATISAAFVVAVLVSTTVASARRLKQSGSSASQWQPARTNQSSERNPAGDRLQLTLVRIEAQTHDAKTLRFALPPGRHIAARPGQFLTFEWIIDGQPVVRSYSICSSPIQAGLVEITPKRVPNGRVSQFLNDRAMVGLTVHVRGPYGKFCFDKSRHKRIVLIAGGSGITPMMAMLRYIDDLCISVRATLVYCARNEQDMFFLRDLSALRMRLLNFHFVPVLSQAPAQSPGWKGRLRREILEVEIERLAESTFFLCGPAPFMQHARMLLRELAVDPVQILQESFGGAVAGEKSSAVASGQFRVSFVRSGVAHPISPDETLLENSEKNGVLIPSGCRQGSCGTCTTRLLEGEVHMEHAEALNDDLRAQGYILPCVSRPLGDVKLDA